ncbi:PHA/PHB synthase family protein [Thalassomonas actiniarum]|uniref:Class I poly(R)-hydroxyalkanoic acid synthase n=1 Tax=Thalassomonas actiniarum TaxID=485447 RepID=A0AAF0C1Z8_9GAMM|nr:class I poly(R)-hydroxyalkanoic acid synthase [Thalassomonas actiniarum]WDD97478.1 class I poly(R)-hydroxyalkanoic acid synthase [Thalassomonas actiniarum]
MGSGKAVGQDFIQYLNDETSKMLANFSSTETKQAIEDFSQQWFKLTQDALKDPASWLSLVEQYQQQHMKLWTALVGGQPAQAAEKAKELTSSLEQYQNNPVFEYIKQSYLMTSKLLNESAASAALDSAEQEKLVFYTKQFIDAMSPDNFAMTNPDVIKEAVETNGQSLVNGLNNLLSDMDKGRISMTDESAFVLGENLAVTEGAVVYENELFQLIHYKPLTQKVYQQPVLIVPPCINKYYILDLQEHNSFVRYCLEQEQNTFLISWVNPTKEQGSLSWDDYVELGVINAINRVKEITGQKSLHALSWCVGGTLLACAQAVLTARKDNSVASATFLTTLVDFEEPGDISVFIDPQQIESLLAQAKQKGVLSGRNLAVAFNMLRANDLIWSYVVRNYLKGKQPAPFDILYWNGDSTNLPYEMYRFYITQMYLENNLSKPDALNICGSDINLGNIEIPCYFLSTIGDHIAPWQSTYKGMELFGGNKEFVLGASGHVAGVINPVSKNRRHYWVDGNADQGAEHWLATAEKKEGSWWSHWSDWIKQSAGKKIAAPELGSKQYPVIEAAPGRYVKVKLEDIDNPPLNEAV